MSIELAVEKRTNTAAARAAGKVPGVVYGPKQEPISVAIEALAFERTLHAAGESTIITLTGLEQPIEVLIHDVSFSPARGGAEHVDFYAIERGKELTTNVGVEFIGEAPVEKTGAALNKVLQEIEVTCRPSVLPAHLTVDLSGIDSEDAQILVKDIVAPDGVKIENDPEQVVVSVSAARTEESDEAPEAVDMDAVAVEGEDKEEAEDAAA